MVGDFCHPNVGWKSNSATHAESRRFLHHIENDFLMRVVGDSVRREYCWTWLWQSGDDTKQPNCPWLLDIPWVSPEGRGCGPDALGHLM